MEQSMKKPKRKDHDLMLHDVAKVIAKKKVVETEYPDSFKAIYDKNSITRNELFRIRHLYPEYLNVLVAKYKAKMKLLIKEDGQ